MKNSFKLVKEISIEQIDGQYVPVYKYTSSKELYKITIINFDSLKVPKLIKSWNPFN